MFISIFGYALFFWDCYDYPDYAKGPCYSPNHEFYITRKQTPWQRFSSPLFSEVAGMARLYDKQGTLLYEKAADLNEEGGPHWTQGDERSFGSVFFLGTGMPGWMFPLPSSPGKASVNQPCYPQMVPQE